MDEDGQRALPESAQADLHETQDLAVTLIGEFEDRAVASASAQGIAVRIARRDGEDFPLRSDERFRRVNLFVEGGIVVRAEVG